MLSACFNFRLIGCKTLLAGYKKGCTSRDAFLLLHQPTLFDYHWHLSYHGGQRIERLSTEGKFLIAKFEFGESFGMSLERDCHEVEVTPTLELLVTFDMSLEGVCHELYT